jgi:acyl-coenzyme A synthetase/AMP-(fatty) acid ligase
MNKRCDSLDDPLTLRGEVSAANGTAQGSKAFSPVLCGLSGSIPFADLAGRAPLGLDDERLAGRSVILRTSDQFAAAVAMIALDGVAARMVICPPDVASDDLAHAAAVSGAEAIVFDGADSGVHPPNLEPVAFDPLDTRGTPGGRARRATEWVLFTSGTSGVPKLVAHDIEGLTGAIPRQRGGSPPVVWGTFYDIRRYGGLQILLRAALGGGSMILSQEGEPPAAFLARLARHGVTHLSGTPSHWRRALMTGLARSISPRVIRLSGEIADQAILDALKAAFPDAAIGHAYASTEAGVGFEVIDGREGFPAPLLDDETAAVRLRLVDGSLRVSSRRAAHRYVGVPQASLADEEGFVDTGDLVERRGERCYFLGRRGGVINVGGLKVSPEEVEAVINRHPAVAMSRVLGRRSPITGAIVVAEVVTSEAAPTDEAALRTSILAACRRDLPAFKTPASIRIVPALDIGASGKVARA